MAEKILTAIYYDKKPDGEIREVVDLIQPGEGMTEKEFRKIADKHHPTIKPSYEYLDGGHW